MAILIEDPNVFGDESGAEPDPGIGSPDPLIDPGPFDPTTVVGYITSSGLTPEFDWLQPLTDARHAEIHGNPWFYQLFWKSQSLTYNCSVAVQHCILAVYGIVVSQAELNEIATEHGWLDENGASLADIGQLLQYYGIETHTNVNAIVEDLISELQQGHSLIIPLDSGELWAETGLERLWEWMEDLEGFSMPDHVVWITGIDMTDPDNPQVIINDTGHPDGMGQRYPLVLFMDAWADAHFVYIATSEPPPGYEMLVEWERFLNSDSAG